MIGSPVVQYHGSLSKAHGVYVLVGPCPRMGEGRFHLRSVETPDLTLTQVSAGSFTVITHG